jgi:purine-binding chemotaxis protein CheW
MSTVARKIAEPKVVGDDDDEIKEWYEGDSETAEDAAQYLLFFLDDSYFATPLLSVREVIEAQSVKSVPSSQSHFLGIFNLRGEITGAVTMTERDRSKANQGRFLVFETDIGPIALVVDDVVAVISLSDDSIDTKVNVKSKVQARHRIGFTKLGDQLITIVDLKKLLTESELININSLKKK